MATPEKKPIQLRKEQVQAMQEARKKTKEEEMLKLWERICEQNISNRVLRNIVESNPILRKKAAEKIIQQNPEQDDLVCIIRWVPEMREKCWVLLSQKNPSKASLLKVIIFAPDLSEKAWELFSAQNPDALELEYVVKHAPLQVGRKAQELLPESRVLEMRLT